MYWPLGTPRIYAAKLPPDYSPPAYDSDDGSVEFVQNSPSLSPKYDEEDEDDYEQVNDEEDDDEDEDENTQQGKKVGEKEVMDQELREAPRQRFKGKGIDRTRGNMPVGEQGEEQKRHILSLKVARNGMLFATITSSELTIWQMKVGVFILPRELWHWGAWE
jgi:hypothetical protein